MNLTVRVTRPLTELEEAYLNLAQTCLKHNNPVPAEVERMLDERGLLPPYEAHQMAYPLHVKRYGATCWRLDSSAIPKEATALLIEVEGGE